MVVHQMIYSPEIKKHQSHNKYYESLLLGYLGVNGNNLLTLLAADPPSSCPEWVLLHFFSCFPHLCWVPTDSFPLSDAGRAPNPLFLQTGSRKLWIQATARFFVGHNKNLSVPYPEARNFNNSDLTCPYALLLALISGISNISPGTDIWTISDIYCMFCTCRESYKI